MLRLIYMPGWRVHQSKNKTKKQTQLAMSVLGFLILLILIFQLVNFFKFIHHPLSSNEEKAYSWDGRFNINLVFKTTPISVFSYNPEDKTAVLISIPDNTYIDVPGGFGKWQVRSIYDLGKMSKIPGDKLLEQSVSSFLGIPIDGFSSVNLFDRLRRNLFSGVADTGQIKTDLTPLELIRLKMGLMWVRFDKIKQLDLEKLGVLDKQKLPDSTEVFVSDPIRVDSLSGFRDPAIRSENLSVAIFNATQRAGLAQEAKRLITNLGGNVVVTQNAPRTIAKSYVQGQNSKTMERLSQIFNPDCSVGRKVLAVSERSEPNCDKISPEELGTASSRSQIIVVLGEDFP